MKLVTTDEYSTLLDILNEIPTKFATEDQTA